MIIREFDTHHDWAALEECVIELQNYVRGLCPRLPTGAHIVGEYLPHIVNKCEEHHGKIYLADEHGSVLSYALVYSKLVCHDIDSGTYEYGRLINLFVKDAHRGQGIGKKLIAQSKAFVKSAGIKRFKVGMLTTNARAINVYTDVGFQPFFMDMEKELLP